ncbi:MAG: Gfo/Idh/MocA family oxidoreductase [Armatimonadetes bacterium]|nr:Gfo/Idh/MocA family oxidoreductase [Armatimonadota bacterium]
MPQELRVGLIGCGAMGQGHADVWLRTPGARLAAAFDTLAERAEAVAARSGATPFGDLRAMLASGLIDAVSVATPSGLHADQGLAAAEAGLHVVCEKPLDLSIQKADRLIEACRMRGLALACVLQRRTFAGTQAVARAIHQGRMGRLLSCSASIKWWRSQDYYDAAGWRGTWALDCGVLANQAIHAIDHLCWMAGPVAEVEYACLGTVGHAMEAEDHALAVVRFEGGCRGVIEATTCCSPALCSRVEVYGQRGSASFDDAQVVSFGIDGADATAELPAEAAGLGGRAEPMAINMAGHEAIFADFVEALRDGRRPMVTGEDARAAVDVLNKIYRKAVPGQKLGM